MSSLAWVVDVGWNGVPALVSVQVEKQSAKQLTFTNRERAVGFVRVLSRADAERMGIRDTREAAIDAYREKCRKALADAESKVLNARAALHVAEALTP